MALNLAQRLRQILHTWPLPAVVAWLVCWGVFRIAIAQAADLAVALGLASGLGVLLSLWGNSWWRRLCIAAGFPLSLLLSSPTLAQLPAWGWLIPLGLLLLVYPVNAWRDAPLFPTPLDALDALPVHAPLPAGAQVLDAGCGLGHGLQALRRAYPQAQLHGLEWSWPLRALCALRCPWARVRRADIWQADWSGYDLVYVFQRPESMARAAEKARAELRPGAWLVSLEFEATLITPTAQLLAGPQRPLWVYQAPLNLR